jgi:hypothetical protein
MSEDERASKRARLLESAPLDTEIKSEQTALLASPLPLEADASQEVAALQGEPRVPRPSFRFTTTARPGGIDIYTRSVVGRLPDRLYSFARELVVARLIRPLVEMQVRDAAKYEAFCTFFLPDYMTVSRTTPPSPRDALYALFEAERLGSGEDMTFSLRCLSDMFEVVGYDHAPIAAPDPMILSDEETPPRIEPPRELEIRSMPYPQMMHAPSRRGAHQIVATGTIDLFGQPPSHDPIIQRGPFRMHTTGRMAELFGEQVLGPRPLSATQKKEETPPPLPPREVPQEEAKTKEEACCICLTYKINAVYPDCGHMISCYECAKKIATSTKADQRRCPTCRKETKATPIKVFRGDA